MILKNHVKLVSRMNENEINNLYDLTWEEVRVVDSAFTLSKEEYEYYKAY